MIKELNKKIKHNKFYYKGAIHIHSLFSDGTGNIEEISLAAKKTGLDYIIITDHNNLDIKEGFYNGVLVIKGQEISPYNNNHYLAFDIKETITPDDNTQKVVNDVKIQGGFGIAAHPDESENRNNEYEPIRWTNKEIIPQGVEIWNWFSSWTDKYNSNNILSIIYAFLFKHKLVKTPCTDTINWWDRLNNNTPDIIPATGGIDAHALKIKKYILPVTIFPYKKMFKTISNVVLLDEVLSDDFNIAKKQILNAIKNGNNIIVNRKTCKKVPFVNIANNKVSVSAGEKIDLDNNTYINVEAPKKALVKIIRNGEVIYNSFKDKCRMLIKKAGKYRVEILIKGYGFAYTNPILVVEG